MKERPTIPRPITTTTLFSPLGACKVTFGGMVVLEAREEKKVIKFRPQKKKAANKIWPAL